MSNPSGFLRDMFPKKMAMKEYLMTIQIMPKLEILLSGFEDSFGVQRKLKNQPM